MNKVEFNSTLAMFKTLEQKQVEKHKVLPKPDIASESSSHAQLVQNKQISRKHSSYPLTTEVAARVLTVEPESNSLSDSRNYHLGCEQTERQKEEIPSKPDTFESAGKKLQDDKEVVPLDRPDGFVINFANFKTKDEIPREQIYKDTLMMTKSSIPRASASTLEANMQLGKSLADFVTSTFFSPNNLVWSYEVTELQNNKTIYEKYCKFTLEVRDKVYKIVNGRNKYIALMVTASQAVKYNVGACDEMTAIAFMAGLQKTQAKLDMYSIEDGNHAFLVIGRSLNSDSEDFTTWGPNCVICDPWSRKVYPASQISTMLMGCEPGMRVGGIPVLIPFNPSMHKLSLLSSNIFSPNDFAKETNYSQNKRDTLLIQLLKEFHDLEMGCNKIKIAKKIIKIASAHPLSQERDILSDQCRLFIEVNNFED